MNFKELGLIDPLTRAVAELGYLKPSPIQLQAIPAILQGRDILASAQTGTGKTAGFVLPILQKLAEEPQAKNSHVKVLILTPTRELAAQVRESVEQYGRHLKLRSTVVFGGVKINPQIEKLRSGVEILVATPGRLMDLHAQGTIKFNEINTLILDEADRMLDMGFIHDIKRIIKLLPKERQNLLFSATFSNEIRRLIKSILNNPVEIEVAPRNTTVNSVTQTIYRIEKSRKIDLLIHLIEENNWKQTLVFSRTKHGANRLAERLLRAKIGAAAIHGNKSQSNRTKVLAGFKSGEIRVLVATDIAARGIDIDQLPCVVNFDLPNVAEDYVHRIGRTGRASAVGMAVSLVTTEERPYLQAIEKLIQQKLEQVELPNFKQAPNSGPPATANSQGANKRPGSNRKPQSTKRPARGQPKQGSRRHSSQAR